MKTFFCNTKLGQYPKFESTLCGLAYDDVSVNNRATAVNFLNANACYLDVGNAEALVRLRERHATAFGRWQQALFAVTRELSGSDEDFTDRARELFESEIQPQLDELRQAMTRIGGAMGEGALVTTASLSLALLSNATLPFGAVLALGSAAAIGKSLPSVVDYLAKRRGPAFIWSKLIHK